MDISSYFTYLFKTEPIHTLKRNDINHFSIPPISYGLKPHDGAHSLKDKSVYTNLSNYMSSKAVLGELKVYSNAGDIESNEFHRSMRKCGKTFFAFGLGMCLLVTGFSLVGLIAFEPVGLSVAIGVAVYHVLWGIGLLIASYTSAAEGDQLIAVKAEDFLSFYERKLGKESETVLGNQKFYLSKKDYWQVRRAIDALAEQKRKEVYYGTSGSPATSKV